MEINVKEHNYRVSTVSPVGRLDAFTAPKLRNIINQQCEAGVLHFVIDLSGISFMDSAGVTVLVSLLRRIRPNGGDVKLVRPTQEAAMRVLRLTKMDQAFTILENLDEPLLTF